MQLSSSSISEGRQVGEACLHAQQERRGEGRPAPCLGLVGRRHSSTSGFCICSATCWSGIQSWPRPGEGRVPLSSPRVGGEVWAACKAPLFSQGTRLPGFAKLPCGGKDQPIHTAHCLGSGMAGIQDLETPPSTKLFKAVFGGHPREPSGQSPRLGVSRKRLFLAAASAARNGMKSGFSHVCFSLVISLNFEECFRVHALVRLPKLL